MLIENILTSVSGLHLSHIMDILPFSHFEHFWPEALWFPQMNKTVPISRQSMHFDLWDVNDYWQSFSFQSLLRDEYFNARVLWKFLSYEICVSIFHPFKSIVSISVMLSWLLWIVIATRKLNDWRNEKFLSMNIWKSILLRINPRFMAIFDSYPSGKRKELNSKRSFSSQWRSYLCFWRVLAKKLDSSKEESEKMVNSDKRRKVFP
jgi:hypothetical protein